MLNAYRGTCTSSLFIVPFALKYNEGSQFAKPIQGIHCTCMSIYTVHIHVQYTHVFSLLFFTYSYFSPCRYYYAMVADVKEDLVEASCNLLAVIFNFSPPLLVGTLPQEGDIPPTVQVQRETGLGNLFLAYLARLHQSDVS